MKYSNIKELFSSMDRDEVSLVVENLGSDSFENDSYRFIKESEALGLAIDMYDDDAYMLGCFNADFIADMSDLSYEIVKALQEGEKYEAIGQYLLDNDCVGDMMEEYIRLDGYGHVFSSYDGDYEEVSIEGEDYIMMRIN